MPPGKSPATLIILSLQVSDPLLGVGLTLPSKVFPRGNSLAVQWLGLCASIARSLGSIPDQGAKIPQAVWHGRKNKVFPIGSPWASVLEVDTLQVANSGHASPLPSPPCPGSKTAFPQCSCILCSNSHNRVPLPSQDRPAPSEMALTVRLSLRMVVKHR